MRNLNKYEKALKQRNELLKKETLTNEILFSWNILLSEYGVEIQNQRKLFIEEINNNLTTIYQSIAKNKDEIKIEYKTEADSYNINTYLKKLELDYEKDHYLGHTSFGIHRDDYIFYFNQKPANGSASRGETRSIILALKFTEAALLNQKLNQKPLILLDDVFSELDETRRRSLIDNFKNHQVIITSVESI